MNKRLILLGIFGLLLGFFVGSLLFKTSKPVEACTTSCEEREMSHSSNWVSDGEWSCRNGWDLYWSNQSDEWRCKKNNDREDASWTDTSHWGTWSSWSTNTCLDSQTKKCEFKIQHRNNCGSWVDGECPKPTSSPTPTPTVSPTPTATPTATPTQETSQPDYVAPVVNNTTEAPVCTDGNTILLPANAHVIRKGTQAIVNWFETQGDEANIYYKEVGMSNWTHSVPDVKVIGGFGSVTINELNANLGYIFGIQQKVGCGGGQLVTAVIIDGAFYQVFPFSYWTW